jgi:hypothetical protein
VEVPSPTRRKNYQLFLSGSSIREDAMKLALMLLALVFAGVAVDTRPTSANASQEEKKKSDAKETKWQGTVLQILKGQSMMNIRGGSRNNASDVLKIAYDSSTQWTKQNKPGDFQGEVKEGSFVIAVGQVDDKGVLHATRIDLRLPR